MHLTAAMVHDSCSFTEAIAQAKLYLSDELLLVLYFDDYVESDTDLEEVWEVLRDLPILPFRPHNAIENKDEKMGCEAYAWLGLSRVADSPAVPLTRGATDNLRIESCGW